MIRIVEAPVDPMEPPKFKHKRVPGGPGSPPVPEMHSPPRKLSSKDMADWKIPPAVSNWKNAKGYTIAIDKRVGMEGRSHLTMEINDNFAKLAEALQVAQETAAQSIAMRNKERESEARRQKEKREEELRRVAREARAGRTGMPEPGEEFVPESRYDREVG